jgi:Phage head maturation protease
MHGVQSLIRDGALKSFSVGFRVKDASYDKNSDTFFIKDLELLEISVVSVPANQDSLFSVRKSFEDDNGYEEFKKQFITEDTDATTDADSTTTDVDNSVENILEVVETKELAVQVKEVIVEEVSAAKDSATTISEDDDPHKPIPFL